MRLPFDPAAADELVASAGWYEAQRPGYGGLFFSEVQAIVDRAAEFPQSGASVPGFDPAHDVRRFVLRSFPYLVVTAAVRGQRVVLAVAHGNREPGYWRDRVT